MLSDRKRKILQIIIEDYIETAEPVGSRTIARKHNLGLSPATIRNEMSDLEMLGYLEQPHTSAGRVPSAAAYRLYVDSLKPANLTDNDRALIDGWFRERIRNMDDIFKSTAKILSRMTQSISVIVANKQSSARFQYLKFLPLNDTQVILCIVTDDGNMDNGLITIPAGMTPGELDYLAGRMSRLLAGRPISEIDADVLQEVYSEVSQDEVMLHSLQRTLRSIAAKNSEQKVFLGGTKQILNQPEFQNMDRVKDLLGILEEEKVVKDLVAAGDGESGLKVTIGSENKFTGIKDCSMVQATYRLNGEIVGTMAVLGPTRMEYRKVIAVMNYLHQYLETLFKNPDGFRDRLQRKP